MPQEGWECDNLEGTAVQRGVGYLESNPPTFSSGNLVPMARTVRVREVSGSERLVDEDGKPSRFGTSGHHLVMEGDYKVKLAGTVPNRGDTLTDSVNAWKWLVTGEPQVFGHVGSHPVLVRLELEYWPAAQGDL